MTELFTQIEFVACGSGGGGGGTDYVDAASSAQTGDFFPIIIAVCVMLLAGLCVVAFKAFATKRSALYVGKHQIVNTGKNNFSAEWLKYSLIIFVVIAVVSLLFGLCVFSQHAFATDNPGQLSSPNNTNELKCKDKVIAYVDQDSNKITIEDGFIFNGDENNVYQLSEVSLDSNDAIQPSTWTIDNNYQRLYSGQIGQTIKVTNDPILYPNQSETIKYTVDMPFDQALALCGTTPVTAKFGLTQMANAKIYGTLTTQMPSLSHQLDATNTQVIFRFVNPQGVIEERTSDLQEDGSYTINNIPLIETSPIKGILSCRKDGYYFQKDVVVDKPEVEVNGQLKCGLDNYTIDELVYISDDISMFGEASGYYYEFVSYMQKDELWLSNSNSQQVGVSASDTTNLDPAKCNQAYINNFEWDESIIVPQNKEKNQFLFLRVIGINQDEICNTNGQVTGKKAGLTFQSVRSLPQSYSMSSSNHPAKWWGDTNNTLNSTLNSDKGAVYANLCSPIKNALVNVAKKSQVDYTQKSGTTVKNVASKMFPLSYTEMYSDGSRATRFDNNDYYKDSAEGAQYSWYKTHGISGSENNDQLSNLGTVNSGEAIAANAAITYQRTPYYQAESMFLTTNSKGAIYTYDYDASNKNGVAPAFSLGSTKGLNTITFDAKNCKFVDTNGELLSAEYLCANHRDISFKVIPDSGFSVESVMCDGVEIAPSGTAGDTYIITDIVANHTITVKLGGEASKTTIITGTSKLEKNGIGEKRVSVTNLSNVELIAKDMEGNEYGKVVSDENGSYRLVCESSCVGKTGYLTSPVRPGVLEYKSDQFTFKKDITINIDPIIHGLDFYTIAELQSVGGYLSSLKPDQVKNNPCYKEFHEYLLNDTIWYSNSNGNQPQGVSTDNTEAADYTKCNAQTKCNFVQGDSIDNFLFFRVIGIRHDPRKDGMLSGFCGLTMQTVRALPISFTASSTWWGEDTNIRSKLARDGDVFNMMSQEYKTWLVDNKKSSQKDYSETANIGVTEDWMFVPSYSEIWAQNGELVNKAPWYDNGSSQEKTEGKLYEWYKNHKVDGVSANAILTKMSITNSGNSTYTDKGTTWLRSIFYDGSSSKYHMAQRNGFINSNNYDFSKSVVCPCICY